MATGRGERAAKRAAKRTDETVEIKTRESYFGGNRPLLLRTSRKQVRVRRRNLPLLGDTVPSSFHPFVPLLFSSSAAISRVAYVRAFLSSFLDRERERDTHTEIIAPSLCLRKREKEKKKREEKKTFLSERGLRAFAPRRLATLIIRPRNEERAGSMLGQHIKIMASIGRWFVYTNPR